MRKLFYLCVFLSACIAPDIEPLIAPMPTTGEIFQATLQQADTVPNNPVGYYIYDYTSNYVYVPKCDWKFYEYKDSVYLDKELYMESNGSDGSVGHMHYEIWQKDSINLDSSVYWLYQVMDTLIGANQYGLCTDNGVLGDWTIPFYGGTQYYFDTTKFYLYFK